jgi:phenylpropionate dioxygenase-like ring-hydroxylating dioxygenase large terminal subunit
LKNFWYAAALSDSVVEGKPHGVGLMGRELVLWRGEDDTVQCIDNTCPHR